MEDLVHPITGPQRVVGPVATMSETPTKVHGPAPVLGADSVEVLLEHNLSSSEVDVLLGMHVVSIPPA
jgi:crotonobetainyl-CoA:carnitine CoA-transferase CaiB-like acyl-CoA transferase